MNQDNAAKLEEQKKAAIKAMASASLLVRDAVAAALPVAPEQYLTIAIPGTVIDTADIAEGGSFVYDVDKNPFIPTAVRQAEAKLVDGMTPLATVMIGNTGKSVSRSYATALDFLVPKKATISTQKSIRSPGSESYDKAMAYLTKKDSKTGLTPVEVYKEKQKAWAAAQDAWDTAKIEAKVAAEKDNPNDNTAAVQQFNDWAQSHYRRFKNETQACWMDWVTNGDKYNVEYNFGLVDVDSIMARIESSKQSMRNATIIDADGANELQEVNLTPKKWAFMCKQKAEGFSATHGNYSHDQLIAEIGRLQKFQTSLEALKAELSKSPPGYPKASPGDKPDVDAPKKALTDAYTALYDAQADLNSAATDDKRKKLDEARTNLAAKIADWEDSSEKLVKWNLSQPGGDATWLQTLLDTVADQINKLEHQPAATADMLSAIIGAHATEEPTADNPSPERKPSGNDLAQPGSELADPIFGISPPGSNAPAPVAADPWTKITASFSASDQDSLYQQSSWGFSVGASASWFGLFGGGGAYSHDESTSDFRSDMAKCDVSVSFSALVVNIDRPWLYAELFNDFEIDIGDDAKLSPGPELLHQWIAKQSGDDRTFITSLAMYNTFPAFPTSFIVAADTVLEFTGETSHIEKHFHSVSNSASYNFGWGPWSSSGSFHSSSSSQRVHIQTTATGCKISFAAPQIIAWVSQILPALPRNANYEPLLQDNAH